MEVYRIWTGVPVYTYFRCTGVPVYIICSRCTAVPSCTWRYTGSGLEYQLLVGPAYIIIFTISGVFMGILADRWNSLRTSIFFYKNIKYPFCEISCLWNMLVLKCPVYEMSCLWNMLSLKCPVYEMSWLWNMLTLKCPVCEMSWLWNMLTLKCPVCEMSCLWNVLSMKCHVYEICYL